MKKGGGEKGVQILDTTVQIRKFLGRSFVVCAMFDHPVDWMSMIIIPRSQFIIVVVSHSFKIKCEYFFGPNFMVISNGKCSL